MFFLLIVLAVPIGTATELIWMLRTGRVPPYRFPWRVTRQETPFLYWANVVLWTIGTFLTGAFALSISDVMLRSR